MTVGLKCITTVHLKQWIVDTQKTVNDEFCIWREWIKLGC